MGMKVIVVGQGKTTLSNELLTTYLVSRPMDVSVTMSLDASDTSESNTEKQSKKLDRLARKLERKRRR